MHHWPILPVHVINFIANHLGCLSTANHLWELNPKNPQIILAFIFPTLLHGCKIFWWLVPGKSKLRLDPQVMKSLWILAQFFWLVTNLCLSTSYLPSPITQQPGVITKQATLRLIIQRLCEYSNHCFWADC